MDYDSKSTAMDIDDTLAEPSPTANRICHNCQVPELVLPRPLSHCAKCNQTLYCSRTCQRADWKSHKKNCGKTTTSPKSSPPPSPTANLKNNNDDNEEEEQEEEDKPTLTFPLTTATRTTLPSLLLKTYLLRLHDEHRLDQRHHRHDDDDDDDDYNGRHYYERFQQFGPPSPPADTLLSAHGNPLRDYRRFLDRAEAAAAAGALALPAWYWSSKTTTTKKKKKEEEEDVVVGEAARGGDGGNSNNNISDTRRACEHLAKYGGLMIEGRAKRRVASLFESEMDLAMGQFELDHDEVMEEALRGLAVKICGTEVVWAGEHS